MKNVINKGFIGVLLQITFFHIKGYKNRELEELGVTLSRLNSLNILKFSIFASFSRACAHARAPILNDVPVNLCKDIRIKLYGF